MRYLATKEERTIYRKTHNTYFKCVIVGHWLSDDYEVWGYVLDDDLKQAKKLFNKETDEQLDEGILDYGFMHIGKFKKQGNKWALAGEWVNYFGKWLTKDKFEAVAYGLKLDKIKDLNYTDTADDLEQAISNYLSRKYGGYTKFEYLDNGDSVRVFVDEKTLLAK